MAFLHFLVEASRISTQSTTGKFICAFSVTSTESDKKVSLTTYMVNITHLTQISTILEQIMSREADGRSELISGSSVYNMDMFYEAVNRKSKF